MYEPCILSSVSGQRIQYNTIQYTGIRKTTNFFNRSHNPSASPHPKRRHHSTTDTVVNTFQCKTNDLIVHTLPRSNDQISLHTDDITHDICTRICNIPPPSLFGLGKDKKSRVVHELNEYHIAGQIRIKMKGWALQSKTA